MPFLTKVYHSKIAYWLHIPIALFLLYFFGRAVIEVKWLGILITALACGLVFLPMLLNTRYTIKDGVLTVKCGFFINMQINIANITAIETSKSMVSAPALSFDRLQIFYNRFDSVIISPENKEDFIQTLKQINPAIVIAL